MKYLVIHTLWGNEDADPGDVPYIVDAVDELTIEVVGYPDRYEKNRANPKYRELLIRVPEKALLSLFDPQSVDAEIVKP